MITYNTVNTKLPAVRKKDITLWVKKVAEKYNLPFITLQDKFDAAGEKAENSYWLIDGVHPTGMGHNVIKKAWLEQFAEME